MTWSDAVEGYLLDMRARGLRPRTVDLHREQLRVIRRMLDDAGAPADPLAIERTHIQGILRADRDAGMTPRTSNIPLSTLRTLFAYLVREGVLAAEDVSTNGVPKLREGRRLPRALSDADIRLLLAACNRATAGLRDYAMI